MTWTTAARSASMSLVKNRGITFGDGHDVRSDSPVTRLQMAAFMYRLGFQNAFLQEAIAFSSIAQLGTLDNNALQFTSMVKRWSDRPGWRSPSNRCRPRRQLRPSCCKRRAVGEGKGTRASNCTLSNGCANVVIDDYHGRRRRRKSSRSGRRVRDRVGRSEQSGVAWLVHDRGRANQCRVGERTQPPMRLRENLATGAASFAAGQGAKPEGER